MTRKSGSSHWSITRRSLLQSAGAAGVAAGIGSLSMRAPGSRRRRHIALVVAAIVTGAT